MRILFTIPHYFNPEAGGQHGALRRDPQPRVQALSACLFALHASFGRSQCMIEIAGRVTVPANPLFQHALDVVVCTTQDRHLLAQLPLPPSLFRHRPTNADPMLLGFECQAVLREELGNYDYYCYLEDDLILHDPWFFAKLAWFTNQVGNSNLLLPNRYEISAHGLVSKAYIDGDLAPRVTAPFQNIQEQPEWKGRVLDMPVVFRRTLNPHSGCYFLNAKQMAHWAAQPHFLDRDTRFVGPLESAATLGIMRTFRVYKPAPEQASFLEIQHYGTAFLGLIGGKVRVGHL